MRQLLLSSAFVLASFLALASRDTLAANSLLYNGTEYLKQFDRSKGTPFFDVETSNGSVFYQGNWYRNIEVHYDCEDDEVLVRDVNGQLRLQLIKEKIEEFTIGGHHFVKLRLQNARGEFYEQLHKGSRTLLAQWKKTFEVDVKDVQKYVTRKSIYLLDNEKLKSVSSISDIYALAPQHQKELKKFYRDNKLSYKKDPVTASKMIMKEIEDRNW